MPNTQCPDFTLPATAGESFSLATSPKPLVLFFYPKDNTPGCTNEAIAFRDLFPAFRAKGACIAGISRDGLKSHESFKSKYSLPFALLADTEETVCRLFDVIKTKNMYGKKVLGIERSTFVIGNNGNIIAEWRGVKVPGHAEEVLAFIESR